MYATCSYGKHYEELLQTAKHLGHRLYAMAKFCETRFAHSKLMVYKNFEKNYCMYHTAWSGDAVAVELELDAATITATETISMAAVAAIEEAAALAAKLAASAPKASAAAAAEDL